MTNDALAGTELMTFNLVKHTNWQEFEVHVAVLMGRGPLAEEYERLGIAFYDLEGHQSLSRGALILSRLMIRYRFDIAHFYGFKISAIGRFVVKLVSPHTLVMSGVRDVQVSTAGPGHWTTRAVVFAERLMSRPIDYYVANSRGAIQFLSKHGLPYRKLVYIANGIDLVEWKEPDYSETKFVPVIVSIARFVPKKRHLDLIHALSFLARSGMKFQCILIGDGPTRQAMEQLAHKLNVADKVFFGGTVSRSGIKELLYKADIFVLPSLHEGMPGSVMEAMAAGLPIIGTDVNGINELVIDGKTGYLVPPKNPEALADRLALLMANPQARIAMGQYGRKRIAEEFTLDLMVERTEAFYRSAVTERASSAQAGLKR